MKCWHKRDGDSKATPAAGNTHCTKPVWNRKERWTTILLIKILLPRSSAARKARCNHLFFEQLLVQVKPVLTKKVEG